MTTIAARDLRNHTAEVLRQVAAGTPVTVTVNGKPVAELRPHRSARQSSISRLDLTDIVLRHSADPGLRADLAQLAGDSTEELGPV